VQAEVPVTETETERRLEVIRQIAEDFQCGGAEECSVCKDYLENGTWS